MEMRKRERLTSSDLRSYKTNIMDLREGTAALGSPEVDDVEEVEESQVITGLPADVESLGSTNHIHVQLLDGQVIQITSRPLEETDEKDEAESMKRDCNGCVEGNVESGGGTVTLISSNGKTYILPQPLTTAEEGGYLISEEVFSTEEVCNVLEEEQMLTISPPPPPPPQATLDFTASVPSHPDALAIATSEVFSENYVPVPMQTHPLPSHSKAFQLKTVDAVNAEEMRDKVCGNPTDSERMLILPDSSVITIYASDNESSNEWMDRNNQSFGVKRTRKCSSEGLSNEESSNINEVCDKWMDKSNHLTNKRPKTSSTEGLSNEESAHVNESYDEWMDKSNHSTNKRSKTTSAEGVSNEEKANNTPHANYREMNESTSERELRLATTTSSYTKLVTSQKDDANEESAITEEGDKEVKSGDACDVRSTSKEKDERNMQLVSCDDSQDNNSSVGALWDKMKLRRSSRIRKVKKVLNEEDCEVPERDNAWKRRKGSKEDTPSTLWECSNCDAMFRTRVSRDRHMREGHAFTCFMCGWKGPSKTKYEIHISTVHCNQLARCLACRKDFQGYESYKQHMKEIHSTTLSASTSTTSSITTSSTASTATTIVKSEVEYNVKVEEQADKCNQSGDIVIEKHDPDNADFNDSQCQSEQSCPYCNKTFTRHSRFVRHLNYHLGIRTYMCNTCSKCFVEKSGLDAHLLTHCPINKECSQCGKVCKTERTMSRHLRTHLNRTYTCEFCNKQFRHEESLRVHKSVHKEGGSGNTCKLCQKDCKTPHYLQLHMTTKHEAPKFTCQQCDRSFKWKQSYRKHMAINHGDAYDLKYKCDLCPRHFMTTSELRLHQVVHSTEKKHLCDICGKAFKHEYTRDKHTKTVHRENREHRCPQCGTLFKAKVYLDQHLAHVHTTKERVVCKYCGNDFKTEANLRGHIKVVHKPRNPKYTCETCHKMFLSPKDLLRHSKVHTGIKDYVCPKCRRCFSRKDNMIAHLRTHTQQSPDSSLGSEAMISDVVISQDDPQAPTPQEMPHILSLPSSVSPNMPASSSNIILSNTTAAGSIVLSEVPENSIVLSSESSLETQLTNPASSCITAPTETHSAPHRVSITSLPVSSMADITTVPPSSAGSIIFSTVPVSSFKNASSSSSNPVSTLVYSTSSASGSTTSSSSNISAINPSQSSPIINLTPSSPLASHTTQTYTFHPHLVVSSPSQVSSISSLLTASVPSSALSLPSHSSAPVLVSQNSRTQMVCSTLQGEQVVLTAGPLTPITKVSIHDGASRQYTQLDPLSASVCSTPSSSLNVSINPLSPTVSSTATLGSSVPLSAHSTPHTPSVDVTDPVESNIILPTSTILQEAALILPEKTGLYTIVGGGGKITPLETLTLHTVPPPPTHSD